MARPDQNPRTLLRDHDAEGDTGKVGAVELFFDLVFVFAVTQLSHGLLAHPTLLGAAQTGVLLLATWWVWMYTTWATNWLDVGRMPVRVMLFVLMGFGLLLSLSIPEAFGDRGWVFAGAYLAMQIGRSTFTLVAFRGQRENYRNLQRIISWSLFAAPLWVVGALSASEARLWFWAAALAIEYAGPAVYYRTPGLGSSRTTSWVVEGHHMAERCGLFIIIALGESILITGATFAKQGWNAATLAALASAFLATVAMWWIYFNIGAERGTEKMAAHDDPGRMARLAYTYLHLPIVAGIIIAAASDELVLAHPLGRAEPFTAALVLGGPALYLVGNIAFKRTTATNLPLSHLGGLALLGAVALIAPDAAPLLLGLIATCVLIVVAAWETLSWRGRVAAS